MDLNKANQNAKDLNNELDETQSKFGDLRETLGSINAELGKKVNRVKDASKAYTALGSIAQKFQAQEEGLSSLSDKQINQLQEKAKIQVSEIERAAKSLEIDKFSKIVGEDILKTKDEDFQTAIDLLKVNGELSSEQEALLRAKKQGFTIENDTLVLIAKEAQIRKDVNSSLGITGGILKGLNQIGGGFAQAFKLDLVLADMTEFADETIRLEGSVSRLAVLGKGMGSAFKNAFATITDPTFVISNLLKGFASVDKANVDFQRTTGQNANTLGNSYSVATGELITLSQYIQQASDLSKELGMNAMDIFSAEDLLQVSTMQKTMGMSVKESNQLAILSKINGNNVRDNNKSLIAGVNAFNGQNKQGVLAKTVLNDVANVSEDIALTYLGYPEKLGAAATAAASMGTNLSGVAKIAEGLLNFESSIAAEMEAELLTGQSLNLEKARQFALMNDLEGVATELLNQGITSLSYSKLNFIQQKAQAAALGMTRAEMSKMLMTQGLSVGMSKAGLTEMQNQTLESMEQQEVQEKLSAAVAKMQQAFAPIVGFIADIVSNTVVLNSILAVVAGTYVVKMGLGFLRMVGYTGSILKNMGLMSKLGGAMSKVGSLGSSLLPTPTKAPVKVPGGVVAKKNLQGLAAGLRSMGTPAGKIALGIVNLGLFGVAGAIALLAIPFLRSFQTINGIALKTNFQSLAAGLRSFGTGKVGVGVLNLAGLGAAGVLMAAGSIGLLAFTLLSAPLATGLGLVAEALRVFANPIVVEGAAILLATSLGLGISFALVGAGAMMMGKGISLAATGFSVMVPHLLSLIPHIPALGLLALSLIGIGTGLALIATAGIAALPALMGLAALATISAGIYSTFSGDEEGGDSDKGMAKINANLEKLISLVEAGGNVYLDGAEMGKIVSMSDSRMG